MFSQYAFRRLRSGLGSGLVALLGLAANPRRRVGTVTAVVVAWSLAQCQAGPPAQQGVRQPMPRTVLDYYLLLPRKYFDPAYPKATLKERLSLVKGRAKGIVDIRNGYLFASGDGAQPSFAVYLFKRPDGTYLVAVGQNEKVVFDPFLDFYVYRNGRLRAVADPVFPVPYSPKLDYHLPRYGTTIRVTDPRGKHRYSLQWNGRQFVLHRPART